MPARTGRQYLAGLREQEREVWLEGERVKDPTRHPGLRGGARAIASLYDMQCDPKLRDEMTYVSPTTGDRVGLSFIIPRTREDLERRRVMILNWARTTCNAVPSSRLKTPEIVRLRCRLISEWVRVRSFSRMYS